MTSPTRMLEALDFISICSGLPQRPLSDPRDNTDAVYRNACVSRGGADRATDGAGALPASWQLHPYSIAPLIQ